MNPLLEEQAYSIMEQNERLPAEEAVLYEEDAQASDEPESMSDSVILGVLREERANAIGGPTSELTEQWETAWKYYRGDPRGDECQGLSAVQSLDVADMTESLLSQVMPIFMTDTVATFESRTPEDAEAARREADHCNYVIMEENCGFIILQEAIKTALLMKNGILKAYPRVKYTPSTESHKNISHIQLAQITAPQSPDEQVVVVAMSEVVGEVFTPGGANVAEIGPIYDVTLRRVKEEKSLHIEAIPPEEFLVNDDHGSIFLDDARYVEHARAVTRSELISMGYDEELVANLSDSDTGDGETVTSARKAGVGSDTETADKSTDSLFYREAFVLLDVDKDGFAERRRICSVGGTILLNEEVEFHPFVAGTPYIIPNSYLGVSIFDKLKEVQDQKTSVLRSYLDNLQFLNHGRTIALEGKVNYDDLLNSRPRGVVRVKQLDAAVPMPVNDSGPSSLAGLDYLDKIRTDRAGASLDLQNKQSVVPSDSAHGVERQISAKELMAAQITRTLAETLVKSLYLLVHKTLRVYFPEEVPPALDAANTQGQTPVAPPGKWLPRKRVQLTIGLTPGEKAQKLQMLSGVLQTQLGFLSTENPLVGEKQIYATLMEQLRAGGLDNPEQFYLSPDSAEFSTKAEQNEQMQNEQMQMQMQMQQAQMQSQNLLAQAQVQLAQAEMEKVRVQQEKNSLEAQLKSVDLQLKELKEGATQAGKTADIILAKDKMDGDQALELLKLELEAEKQLNAELAQNTPQEPQGEEG